MRGGCSAAPAAPRLVFARPLAGGARARLPVGADDGTKRTPTASGRIEIGMVLPLLDDLELDFEGRTFTADALLAQRRLATFLRNRVAHFVFAAKASQPTLLDDIRLFFDNRGEPDFREPPALGQGRLESRAIRTIDRLSGHLTFPHVRQAFPVERSVTERKSGKTSVELAFGVASHSPDTADPRRLLELNRGHWKVESAHDILDNAFDEDRLRHPHRPRPRQRHPAAPLRHRPDQGKARLRRRRHAPPRPPSPARVRLPAYDRKLPQTQKTQPDRR